METQKLVKSVVHSRESRNRFFRYLLALSVTLNLVQVVSSTRAYDRSELLLNVYFDVRGQNDRLTLEKRRLETMNDDLQRRVDELAPRSAGMTFEEIGQFRAAEVFYGCLMQLRMLGWAPGSGYPAHLYHRCAEASMWYQFHPFTVGNPYFLFDR